MIRNKRWACAVAALALFLGEQSAGASPETDSPSGVRQTVPPIDIAGSLTHPSKHTPVWIARAYVQQHKKLFRLRHPDRDLLVEELKTTTEGTVEVHFQRQRFRVPVWGDRLIVEVDRYGIVRRVSGFLHPAVENVPYRRRMHPALTPSEAAGRAQAWLRARGIAAEPAGDPRLYYVPTQNGLPLAYAIHFEADSPIGDVRAVLVHALSGRILTSDIVRTHTRSPG